MDSDRQDLERSLPGMGIPKWMKKTERFDYGDFCQSPPSQDDGFFQFGGQSKTAHPTVTITGEARKPDCVFRKVDSQPKSEKGPVQSGLPSVDSFIKKAKDCKAPETTSFFKTVSSSSLVNLASTQAALLVNPSPNSPAKNATNNPAQMGNARKLSDSSHKSTSMEAHLNMYKIDLGVSAPTALESACPNLMKTGVDFDGEINAMKIKDTQMGPNSQRVSQDKMDNKNASSGSTTTSGNNASLVVPGDDVTPSTTPPVTPSCSPQLARRNENPFFTGSTQSQSASKSSGSWLFRSSNSAETEKSRGFGNILYEMRNDSQADWKNTSAPSSTENKTAKTRYIPKPSQLRELNFWSPTSM